MASTTELGTVPISLMGPVIRFLIQSIRQTPQLESSPPFSMFWDNVIKNNHDIYI